MTHFYDFKEIFSIDKFCKIAKVQNNAQIGEFWKPNITVSNMIRIFEQNPDFKMEINCSNKIFKVPLQNFVFHLSTIGIIYTDDIFDKIYNKPSVCKCVKKIPKILSKFKYYTSHEFTGKCIDCDFNKTLVIYCFLRTGLYQPEQVNIEYVNALIKSEYFSGGLIGKKHSAYFLLGLSGENYIYLDPHFVQTGVYGPEWFNTFQVKNFRTINCGEINTCVGLSFTVDSFKQFASLRAYFEELKETHIDSFYISFNLYEGHDF